MSYVDIFATSLITQVSKAVLKGPKKIKLLFGASSILLVVALILFTLVNSKWLPYSFDVISSTLGIAGGLGILIIYGYQVAIEETEAKEELKKVEDRVKEHPNETRAAWDLARIRLENYLNRNLNQIQWIFILTAGVMIAGFAIICYGIVKVYDPLTNIKAGIITTTSGVIVEFIGATFLVIYKSTMTQAKDLVNVLERIHAVGMSVQISDNIELTSDLKDQTRSEIAKLLLNMYSVNKEKKKKKEKK